MTLRSNNILLALAAAAMAAGLSLTGCDSNDSTSTGAGGVDTGGGSVGGSDVGGFQLTSISVPNQFVWKINRPIVFVFSAAVSFSSVNLNTISIRDQNGLPASGVFTQDPAEPRIIVFQPTCPVKPDFSDAGFLPGGRKYTIQVLGTGSGAGSTVTSVDGQSIDAPQTREFFTPASTDLSTLFQDSVPGAPLPVVRTAGSANQNATYVEVGEDAVVDNRVFFERDLMTQTVSVPGSGPGSIPLPDTNPLKAELEDGMPLHLYSDRDSRMTFVVEMNQPVNPEPDNISSARIRLEAEQTLGAGDFQAIPSQVTLVRNCTSTGATLRVVPEGVLPPNVNVRVVVAADFEDLTGVQHLAPVTGFARIQTLELVDGMGNPIDASDELLEEFTDGAEVAGSFEDRDAAFAVPRAIWGQNGRLAPRFDFQGTGGPGGAFDLRVRATGGPLVIDTTFAVVQNDTQTLTQTVINGRLDVRNLTIEPNAVLQFRGPNPAVINATGTVQIDGEIECNGFSAKDVAGVNTASFPEPGAAGNLGGGKGGDASIEKNASTPRGSHGAGAFGTPNVGGRGGETGFGGVQGSNPDLRKGAGGGGGVLGEDPDYTGLTPPPNLANGLMVEKGADGHVKATGAINGGQPQGGLRGLSPFTDGVAGNDFFGVQTVTDGMGSVTGIIRGELKALLAGAGGGGGGDCTRSSVFPNPSFTNASEDKGGAAGGGAGAFHLRALGNVIVGDNGRIHSEGGMGARGQIIAFGGSAFVKSGPGGGGGSGGHIVIETARQLDLGAGLECISARGGRGGEGAKPEAGGNMAAAGGAGGPGLVQLHTPNGVADIQTGDELQLQVVPIPKILVPTFGRRSKAQSRWIPLGGAVGMQPDDVMFLFGGTDATGMFGESGLVLDRFDRSGNPTPDGLVDDLPPVIGPASLTVAGKPRLEGEHTVRFDVTAAGTMFAGADTLYGENPLLMKNFVLVLRETAVPTNTRRYNIESAVYDPTDADNDGNPDNPNDLILTTASSALPFSSFTNAVGGGIPAVEFLVIPRFFRVVTSGVSDSLPASSSVKIWFEGTGRGPDGQPLVQNPDGSPAIFVPFSRMTPNGEPGNIDDLWDPSSGAMLSQPIHFFRFQVEFDIDVANTGVSASSPRPNLDFLRIPFTF